MPKEKRSAFNLMLSPAERERLQELAGVREISQGAAIRQMIAAASAHNAGAPTCANGQQCFVPQMHMKKWGEQ